MENSPTQIRKSNVSPLLPFPKWISLLTPKKIQLQRLSACSQEQADRRTCTQGNNSSLLSSSIKESPLRQVFLYRTVQERSRRGRRRREEGKGKYGISHPLYRKKGTVGSSKGAGCTSSAWISATQEQVTRGDQGKENEQAGERCSEYIREKRSDLSLQDETPWEGSVFWWDKQMWDKQPDVYTHKFKNQNESM